MPQRVDLDDDVAEAIARLIETGRYASETEALRQSVRLLEAYEAKRDALDAAIAQGLADADAGRVTDAKTVFDRLERKYRAMADHRRRATQE
ncbi:MAG: type II toxin-antitoxin system ParD family antitoxin [Alphaproteobacteria bacterium]|jgi:antitoxin ParD1/3/4|nr:type II toxin-antitoxin system ParD family antitoxin [Alphaproteobacteria bacterium]